MGVVRDELSLRRASVIARRKCYAFSWQTGVAYELNRFAHIVCPAASIG
jgi:hypothetical protein